MYKNGSLKRKNTPLKRSVGYECKNKVVHLKNTAFPSSFL